MAPSDVDEFGMLSENAADVGLAWTGPPAVERRSVPVGGGRSLSAIVWGHQPELVFLHGGGQNAHTWDTVVLAMGLDALAVDLPGHGHSERAPDAPVVYDPVAMADDVASVVDQLAPGARLVTGMSLGGLVGLALSRKRPDLVDRLAMVDVTPGVSFAKAATMSTPRGPMPESFATLEEIVDGTVAMDPTRSPSSLRRGVIHNTRQLPNGRWIWRYDRHRRDAEGWALGAEGNRLEAGSSVEQPGTTDADAELYPDLWEAVTAFAGPLLLVVGSRSGVVDEADRTELLRRRPDGRVVSVEDAGHRVQGDKPIELAQVLQAFLAS